MDPNKDAILERLEKLERENRRLRRGGLAALLVVALAGILGAARPAAKTLRAQQLVLTDAAGNVRAKLSAENAKFASITLYDAKGRKMLSLNGGGPRPGIAMADVTGKTRVLLGGLSPNLSFYDDAGDTTVSLDGDALGPRLLLFDGAGKMRVHLGGPGPSFDLMDANGYETDIGVSTAPNPRTGDVQLTSAASILMFKREGEARKFIWRAP
jgi:hypothetical protein